MAIAQRSSVRVVPRRRIAERFAPWEPRTVLALLGVLGAAVVFGALVALSPKLAVLALGGAVLLPIGLWSVPALLAVWICVVYLGGLPGLGSYPNHLLLVIVGCGIVAGAARRLRDDAVVASGRVVLPLFAAFVFWEVLSVTWADDVAFAKQPAKDFAYVAVGFVLVLASVRSRQHVRWLAAAFVIGAVLSVIGGIAQNGLTAAASGPATDTATSRFSGGGSDPNYLAAMIVPALMLAGGLSVRASAAVRGALLLAGVVAAVGLAATQSRGGLIALTVAFAAAFVLLKDQRRLVLGTAGAALTGLAAFFVAYPAAWQRIVAVHDGGNGSGRTDIWRVAWSIVTQHPFIGVGLNQFSIVSPTFTRQPGSLGGATALIVNEHIVVHNIYLQLWAETGAVGIALFLALVAVCGAAAFRAAQSFDALGDSEMAALSRAVVLALIGVLTASFFLSNILARQIWVLLALGPVLAMLARTDARSAVSALQARR